MSKIRGFGRPVLDPGKTLFERFPRGEHGQERARVGYGSLRSLHPNPGSVRRGSHVYHPRVTEIELGLMFPARKSPPNWAGVTGEDFDEPDTHPDT